MINPVNPIAAPPRRSCLIALMIVLMMPIAAWGHGELMRIASSLPGGGQLLVIPDFNPATESIFLPESNRLGGIVLYEDIFPSFAWLGAAAGGSYPLNAGVTVTFVVAAPISSGASVRLAGRILDAAGAMQAIGAFDPDPESHVHPEWRLLLMDGVTGSYQISFRLSAPGYSQSPIYTLTLTNIAPQETPTAVPTSTIPPPTVTASATATDAELDTPTATATPTHTATATPSHTATATAMASPQASATSTATLASTQVDTPTATPSPTPPSEVCAGDCDGDGMVSIAELVRAVGLAISGSTEGCAAADLDDDGMIAINELIRAVRSALEGCPR